MKPRFLIGAMLLAGAAYFAVFGGEYGLFGLRQLRAERELESERLDSAHAELLRLQARVDSLQHDSATIERLARERHGLIRPGERLFRFAEDATADSATTPRSLRN